MKLVEWPVVLRMPRRSDVLYTGHWYEGLSTRSDFRVGLNQMMGAAEKSTFDGGETQEKRSTDTLQRRLMLAKWEIVSLWTRV